MGWVLLSILALILLILCIKVRVGVEYSNENTSAYVKWLFLKIPLYPVKKKPEKTSAEPTADNIAVDENVDTETAVEETPAQEPVQPTGTQKPKESLLHLLYRANGVDGLILIVKRVFSYIGTFVGQLMNSVVVEELYIDVSCTKHDAAETAIYYGEVCSTLFPLLGALVSKYKIKKYDFNIYPDFIARFSNVSFIANFYIVPIKLIGIVLLLVFKLLFKVVGRLVVKIFLTMKNDSTGKSNIKNTQEKSEMSNE